MIKLVMTKTLQPKLQLQSSFFWSELAESKTIKKESLGNLNHLQPFMNEKSNFLHIFFKSKVILPELHLYCPYMHLFSKLFQWYW
jgi:hypothetical protein